MTDDITEIVTDASCYTINNATTIYSYGDSVRYTYTQIGGKWYKTGQNSYNSISSNYVCYSYDDIAALSSKSEFEPIFTAIALGLVIVTVMLFWATIRKITIWRI